MEYSRQAFSFFISFLLSLFGSLCQCLFAILVHGPRYRFLIQRELLPLPFFLLSYPFAITKAIDSFSLSFFSLFFLYIVVFNCFSFASSLESLYFIFHYRHSRHTITIDLFLCDNHPVSLFCQSLNKKHLIHTYHRISKDKQKTTS
jgi:hypothetical protein